jgi:ABC-type phosphate/phosphonate transport system substrate-binding protein
VDYVWASRKEIDQATQEKFIQAFTRLQEGHDDEVLKILRGKSFVRANDEEYSTVRTVAQQLKMF